MLWSIGKHKTLLDTAKWVYICISHGWRLISVGGKRSQQLAKGEGFMWGKVCNHFLESTAADRKEPRDASVAAALLPDHQFLNCAGAPCCKPPRAVTKRHEVVFVSATTSKLSGLHYLILRTGVTQLNHSDFTLPVLQLKLLGLLPLRTTEFTPLYKPS